METIIQLVFSVIGWWTILFIALTIGYVIITNIRKFVAVPVLIIFLLLGAHMNFDFGSGVAGIGYMVSITLLVGSIMVSFLNNQT
jgi:hypothetical protein